MTLKSLIIFVMVTEPKEFPENIKLLKERIEHLQRDNASFKSALRDAKTIFEKLYSLRN